MALLKTKVNSSDQRESHSSASKFIRFLNAVSFIAVRVKNERLIFKFVSLKTLLHLLFVVICLCGCQIVVNVAFKYEAKWTTKFETVSEFFSLTTLSTLIILPVLQPMILRYNVINMYFTFDYSHDTHSSCFNDLDEDMLFKKKFLWPDYKKTLVFGRYFYPCSKQKVEANAVNRFEP